MKTATSTLGRPPQLSYRRSEMLEQNSLPSTKIEQFVEKLLAKLERQLPPEEYVLLLLRPDGTEQLTICNAGPNRWQLIQAVPLQGHWWSHVDMTFLVTEDGWIPDEVSAAKSLWQLYEAELGAVIKIYDAEDQPLLYRFTDYVAQRVFYGEWVQSESVKEPTDPTAWSNVKPLKLIVQAQHDLEDAFFLRYATLMQQLIEDLAGWHELPMLADCTWTLALDRHGQLRFEQSDDGSVVSVSYLRPDLDSIMQADPKITFAVTPDEHWVPIQLDRHWEPTMTAANFFPGEQTLLLFDAASQQRLAHFTSVLATNWREQGWLEYAQPADEVDEFDDVPF